MLTAATVIVPRQCCARVAGRLASRREASLAALLPSLLLLTPRRSDARGAGDWSTPGLAGEESSEMPVFEKRDSGVIVQTLTLGQGDRQAQRGDTILLDYVLRRANGYFIYSTLEGVSFQPQDVPTGPVRLKMDDTMLPGLVEAIVGMRKGGRRRVLVPPNVGYLAGSGLQPTMPTFATTRQLENHKREPLVFEVELVNVTGT
jgi:FKBP-type peptidyl-prolyl cis-trans isomerase